MSEGRPAPPPEHKAWWRLLRERAGSESKVHTFLDETRGHRIDVLSGRIGDDHLAATIGLMALDQSRTPGVRIHTEILMERAGTGDLVDNVVSTLAFCAIKDGWQVAPDCIFPGVVAMYDASTGLPHVMFVPIFRWNDMSRVEVGALTIHPLLAIPVSEAEARLVEREGGDALLSRLEDRAVDVNDWHRRSVA